MAHAAPPIPRMDTLYDFVDCLIEDFDGTVQKVTDWATSPSGLYQVLLGMGIGVMTPLIYGPLTQKALKVLGFTAGIPSPTGTRDPFRDLGLGTKLVIAPYLCVIGPIIEELMFRWAFEGSCQKLLTSGCLSLGFSNEATALVAQIATVFFSATIFGLIHFANALAFDCHPLVFLPQVIAATIMGILFSLGKELSGNLYIPIGMHIGNNTLAWGVSLM